MGCCLSKEQETSEYEIILKRILKNNPLSNYSCSYLLNQLRYVEEESVTEGDYNVLKRKSTVVVDTKGNSQSARKTTQMSIRQNTLENPKLTEENKKSYNEDRYYTMWEDLYNAKHPEREVYIEMLNRNNNNTDSIYNKTFNSVSLNNMNLQSKESKDSVSNLSKNIKEKDEKNKIYFAITPEYTDINTKYFKYKPEASILLFFIGFSNDNYVSKAKYFMNILELAGIKPVLNNFKKVIFKYIHMNFEFCIDLCEHIIKEKSLGNVNLLRELNIKENALKEWNDYNILIKGSIPKYSNEISFNLTKDLLIILNYKERLDFDENKMKFSIVEERKKYESVSFIDLCEKIMTIQEKIKEEHISILLTIHRYLFACGDLREHLINKVNI